MNQHDDEQERELQALFDATAAPARRDQRDRLARHSAQIPERARRSWWRGVTPWLAAGLCAAGALALLVRQLPNEDGSSKPPQPVASLDRSALASAMASSELGAPIGAEAALWGDDLEDPLAALSGPEAGEQDPFAVLELLYAPEDDGDLQLVNAAYEASLAERDGAEQNSAEQNGR